MVEKVIKLGSNPYVELFANREELTDANIHIEEAGSDILIAVLAGKSGEGSACGHGESELAGAQTWRTVGCIDRRAPARCVVRIQGLRE